MLPLQVCPHGGTGLRRCTPAIVTESRFIGAGNIASPMAQSGINSGHEVAVHCPHSRPAELGAGIAPSRIRLGCYLGAT